MPELVACPSCGCRVQVGEMMLGQRTRCIACATVFVASADPTPLPRPASPPESSRGQRRSASTPLPTGDNRRAPIASDRLPLCPNCHRAVSWEVTQCPHCAHLFDPIDGVRRVGWEGRRDAGPHRAGLIDALGTISLIAGVLSFCTGPVGMLVWLVTGIPALVMARNDLEQMRRGTIDPSGRGRTDTGRVKAIIGLILMALLGSFFLLWFFEKIH
jgi:hypothetical protein